MHWFHQLISQSFQSGKTSRKGWATRNCPCCVFRSETPDKRLRLGLRTDGNSIGMNCFNCGFKALWKPGDRLSVNFRMYFTAIGYSEDAINEINFKLFQESEVSDVTLTHQYFDICSNWKKVEFPNDTFTFNEWLAQGYRAEKFIEVCEYALSRSLDQYFDKLYYSVSSDYSARIIIPYVYNGSVVGYTARHAIKTKTKRKYLNNNPAEFVYNLDNQRCNKRKFVVLTEGVIDAMHVDGITTFGNKITKEQASIINQLGKEIIVVPDYDEAGEVLIHKAIENNWKVSLPEWKYKDTSESVEANGRICTLRNIINSIETKEFNIMVKWKMNLNRIKNNNES